MVIADLQNILWMHLWITMYKLGRASLRREPDSLTEL